YSTTFIAVSPKIQGCCGLKQWSERPEWPLWARGGTDYVGVFVFGAIKRSAGRCNASKLSAVQVSPGDHSFCPPGLPSLVSWRLRYLRPRRISALIAGCVGA